MILSLNSQSLQPQLLWTMMNKIYLSLLSTKEIQVCKMQPFSKLVSISITICYNHPLWSQFTTNTSLKGVIENYLTMNKQELTFKAETMKVSVKCFYLKTTSLRVPMMTKAFSRALNLSRENLISLQGNNVQVDRICSMKTKTCSTVMAWEEFLLTIDDLLVKIIRVIPFYSLNW